MFQIIGLFMIVFAVKMMISDKSPIVNSLIAVVSSEASHSADNFDIPSIS